MPQFHKSRLWRYGLEISNKYCIVLLPFTCSSQDFSMKQSPLKPCLWVSKQAIFCRDFQACDSWSRNWLDPSPKLRDPMNPPSLYPIKILFSFEWLHFESEMKHKTIKADDNLSPKSVAKRQKNYYLIRNIFSPMKLLNFSKKILAENSAYAARAHLILVVAGLFLHSLYRG